MKIEETIEIRSDIEKVWETFTDLTRWADWNTVLRDIPSGQKRIKEGEKFACSLSPYVIPVYFEPEVQEVIPYEKSIWTGQKFGISSKHEWLFSKTTSGVQLLSRETFSGLPLALGFGMFPKKKIRELTVSLLKDLKKAAESEFS